MPKAIVHDSQTQKRRDEQTATGLNWCRKVSDHVAFGLLVYTGLHIFVTMTYLKSGGGSALPYIALVVLVAAIIPACRWMEMRWEKLSDGQTSDQSLAPVFRRDMALLWLTAIGLPIVLTFGFKAIISLF